MEVGGVFSGSPDALVILGNFTQAATGSLFLNIGDPSAGISPALFQIQGTAQLDGSLTASTAHIYQPMEGDTFQAMTIGGAVIGDFAQKTLPTPPSDLFWDTVFENGVYTLVVRRQE